MYIYKHMHNIIHVQLFLFVGENTPGNYCPTLQATVVSADEKKSWTCIIYMHMFIYIYTYIYIYSIYRCVLQSLESYESCRPALYRAGLRADMCSLMHAALARGPKRAMWNMQQN